MTGSMNRQYEAIIVSQLDTKARKTDEFAWNVYILVDT